MLGRKKMQAFLELAKDHLDGEWLVIGGTVLPMLGHEVRSTMDIEFVCLAQESSNDQQLQLMQIAEDLELPVETINSAGAFFVKKIPEVSDHLIKLTQGKSATIYRPDAWLFLTLKINRLSENDLTDCLAFIEHCADEVRRDHKALHKLISAAMRTKTSNDRRLRLEKINSAIESVH